MMGNILVLGATGFAGRNMCEHLRASGHHVSTASLSTGTDLRELKATVDLLEREKPSTIVNCAAHVGSLNYVTRNAADIVLDNTRMIMNMYQAVATVSPETVVINPIANCAYPATSDTFTEDQWMNGHLHRSVLPYGATRRLLWHTGESFYMQHQVRSMYLFVPNMYGPYDSTDPDKAHALNALVSRFVKASREGAKEIEVWGTGIAIREWLYAKDFARIVEKVVADPQMLGLTEPVNIAQNFGLSVRELVQLINARFDNRFRIRWDHRMPDGAPKKVMDDARFRKLFPDFAFTDFKLGIDSTVSYYDSIYPY